MTSATHVCELRRLNIATSDTSNLLIADIKQEVENLLGVETMTYYTVREALYGVLRLVEALHRPMILFEVPEMGPMALPCIATKLSIITKLANRGQMQQQQ